MTLDPRAVAWFRDRRGIRPETAEAFGVHTRGNSLVFPYPENLEKSRYSLDEDNPFGLEKSERRFTWRDKDGNPAGAGQVPYLPPDFVPRKRVILVEGETDTMAVWQKIPEKMREHVCVIGLSGTGSWEKAVEEKPEYLAMFEGADRVFVVFDNDDPYQNPEGAASVERAWQRIKRKLHRKARRVMLPQGTNDLAEFFMAYGWQAFELLLTEAVAPKLNYRPMDLSKDPVPPDWLLDNFIAIPDITVLWGDGGVSKSLWLMGLAVAIANGDPTFCGMPLNKHGRVVYVDEENPEDIVLGRLKKLGLTEEGQRNLVYYWWPNIKLDEDPTLLYEDVAEVEPVLLALDSFSRLTFADENDVQAMNRMFNHGIYPISRELGVGVVALHHANKEGRIRGATAIRNAADLSVEVKRMENDHAVVEQQYTMMPDKPRRGQTGSLQYRVVGYDKHGKPTRRLDEEERVVLEKLEMPF